MALYLLNKIAISYWKAFLDHGSKDGQFQGPHGVALHETLLVLFRHPFQERRVAQHEDG